MGLNHTHQMDILKDILTNHESDCCGSVAECEQLERLIKSLLVNTNLEQNTKSLLTDIYSYSQQGKYTQHLDEHIVEHRGQLSQWISEIDQFS
ncbi:YtzH-like family protein [Litchfieldia alkalitelluris]|uniref:YtzH-like family protein n=1 Tax=Litchfieldia alkalitelluris TaxID=304268 RepID=UPI00099606FB|nr:YtzH-like family protein [Litchfieldia alkalitelluris]